VHLLISSLFCQLQSYAMLSFPYHMYETRITAEAPNPLNLLEKMPLLETLRRA